MGLLSGFAAVFLLLQMGREWRQCNTRITKDAAEISQHKQQRRRQQATTIATTTTALAAVTMTIRSRTVTISDMTMEKWQATTEMTMTTTNDKKRKKWQKHFGSFNLLCTLAISTYFDGNSELAI